MVDLQLPVRSLCAVPVVVDSWLKYDRRKFELQSARELDLPEKAETAHDAFCFEGIFLCCKRKTDWRGGKREALFFTDLALMIMLL